MSHSGELDLGSESLGDANMDMGRETLYSWLTDGIVPECMFPMMEGDFTISTRDMGQPLDSDEHGVSTSVTNLGDELPLVFLDMESKVAVDSDSVPSFIEELDDEQDENDQDTDKIDMTEECGEDSPDYILESGPSLIYSSSLSQDQFARFMNDAQTTDTTNYEKCEGNDHLPTLDCEAKAKIGVATRGRGRGANRKKRANVKRVRKKKSCSSGPTTRTSRHTKCTDTSSQPQSESSVLTSESSSSFQVFTPTVLLDVKKVKVKKDTEQSTGIHDGSNGWTDLKTNRFLRRQFFDYFNKNKVECLECPSRRFRPALNLINYYYTSTPNVPLESYYYGICTGRDLDTSDCCPKMLKCPDCQEDVAKIDIFRHIVAHFKWKTNFSASMFDRVCKYCLCPVKATSNINAHIDKNHKVLSEVGHCCRICSTTFPDEVKTTIHMWEKHCGSEMPYKCPICDFRTSFLYLAVDHCDQVHVHMKRLVCPICLKCFHFDALLNVYNYLKQHVLGHMLKAENIDCSSCALKFVDDHDYIQHRSDKSLHKSRKDFEGFERYSPTDEFPSLIMAEDPNLIEDHPCTHVQNKTKDINFDDMIDSHEKVFARVLEQMNPSPLLDDPPPRFSKY